MQTLFVESVTVDHPVTGEQIDLHVGGIFSIWRGSRSQPGGAEIQVLDVKYLDSMADIEFEWDVEPFESTLYDAVNDALRR